MARRRDPVNETRNVRRGVALGGRVAVAAAIAGLSGGALLASVAFSGPAGAATNTTVGCGDVYGPRGLVAAINAANASGGGTISLAGGCSYTLTTQNNPSNGLPVVTGSITINGGGSTIARSQAPGTPQFRILDNQGNLTLTGVTVTGGSTNTSGGILNEANANLTLTTSHVVNNQADTAGGIGNRSGGTVRLISSTLNDNTARSGAGLNSSGTATLTSSQVDDNTAETTHPQGGTVAGGGIVNFGSLTLTSTQVKGNTAVRTQPSTFPTQGGGINNGGTVTLITSQVTGNTISSTDGDVQGGGIYNDGTATLNTSGVTNNTASAPSGSAQGGGIFKASGSVTLNNSAVLGNHPNNCAPLNSVAGCFG